MYADRELIRLTAHKTGLQRKIALRRIQCRVAATQVLQPLAWLDRAVTFWHRLSLWAKIAALPFAFVVQRTVSPRLGRVGKLLRWAPLVIGAARRITAAFAPSGRELATRIR